MEKIKGFFNLIYIFLRIDHNRD